MLKSDADLVEELQDKVYALQQLLLALIATEQAIDPRIGDGVREIAISQIEALALDGRHRASIHLTGLVEALLQCRD
nr:hypothetical protein VO57_10705 [Citromicrobium sp. JL2201]